MAHAKIATSISTNSLRSIRHSDWRLRCCGLIAAMIAGSACSGTDLVTPPGISLGGSVSTQTSATGGATQAGVGGTSQASGAGGATSAPSTGGNPATGGEPATGGVKSSGGSKATGGAEPTGGSKAAGGSKATGGVVATGGTKAAGGSKATGGTKAAGGNAPTGGAPTGGVGVATGGGTSAPPSGENSGADCNATSAPLLGSQLKKLPDPFAMHSGTRISAKSGWECRRNEIKADIEKYEIGPKPAPSTATVKATLSGSNLSVAVTTSSGSLTIKTAVAGSGSCVVIATDMDLNVVTGCTKVTFSTNDVIPYNGGSGSQNKSDPFYKVYPDLWGKIGNYTAWSWGVSRLIDGLEQVKDQLKIDTTKIATHGCSYAGKMALFAGALDERVALTIAHESGGGGINAWRASADFKTRTGTDIEKIDNTNYAWFMSSMKSLDPYKLPHDHHELIAMTAPRAIIILGNPEYEWLGDESGYKSTMAAVEVFKALGVADHIGYDFTGNHGHCKPPTTQVNSINAFVDKFLKGKTTANTSIAIKPNSSKFDLAADYDWTAPTLQ